MLSAWPSPWALGCGLSLGGGLTSWGPPCSVPGGSGSSHQRWTRRMRMKSTPQGMGLTSACLGRSWIKRSMVQGSYSPQGDQDGGRSREEAREINVFSFSLQRASRRHSDIPEAGEHTAGFRHPGPLRCLPSPHPHFPAFVLRSESLSRALLPREPGPRLVTRKMHKPKNTRENASELSPGERQTPGLLVSPLSGFHQTAWLTRCCRPHICVLIKSGH